MMQTAVTLQDNYRWLLRRLETKNRVRTLVKKKAHASTLTNISNVTENKEATSSLFKLL